MDQHVMIQRVQEAMQKEYATLQSFQEPLNKLNASKSQYMAQLNENESVLKASFFMLLFVLFSIIYAVLPKTGK